MQLSVCQHAPLCARSEGAKRRKVMKALIFPSGENPQASPAPANLMHPAPLPKGLIPRSTSVTWPRRASRFGGKLSSVIALGDRKGANQFCWRGERMPMFSSGAPFTDLLLSVLSREFAVADHPGLRQWYSSRFLWQGVVGWDQLPPQLLRFPSSTCHLMQLSSPTLSDAFIYSRKTCP